MERILDISRRPCAPSVLACAPHSLSAAFAHISNIWMLMLILIMNFPMAFGSQLLERLEKSEKGRSKLRQAMDLVRARLDEANNLQEQLRAAQQGCPPTQSRTPTNKPEMTRLVSPMFDA